MVVDKPIARRRRAVSFDHLIRDGEHPWRMAGLYACVPISGGNLMVVV